MTKSNKAQSNEPSVSFAFSLARHRLEGRAQKQPFLDGGKLSQGQGSHGHRVSRGTKYLPNQKLYTWFFNVTF